MPVILQCNNPDCRTSFELPVGESMDLATCPNCLRPIKSSSARKEGVLVGKTLDGYRIERWIAKGGMGEVYEATQLNLDRRVALKVLSEPFTGDPTCSARFLC
ncbi:MAG TPA: hypothetical protein EYQ50_23610 [Verrucomicrobiales bacterium]|nr:hypothetical protein [Verrucomicrobiales bacterium]